MLTLKITLRQIPQFIPFITMSPVFPVKRHHFPSKSHQFSHGFSIRFMFPMCFTMCFMCFVTMDFPMDFPSVFSPMCFTMPSPSDSPPSHASLQTPPFGPGGRSALWPRVQGLARRRAQRPARLGELRWFSWIFMVSDGWKLLKTDVWWCLMMFWFFFWFWMGF